MRAPPPGPRPTSSAWLEHALHALGRPEWACAGTPYSAEARLPPRIPLTHALCIADNLARRAADPYLHFRVARIGPPPVEPSVALALQHAPTLAEGLRLAADWCNVAVTALEFELARAGSTLECIVRPRVDLGAATRGFVEAHLDLFYRCVESRRGLDLRDARLEFAHAPAVRADDYREWLRCGIEFRAARSALVVPAAWGGLPAPGADPGVWLLARERVVADATARRQPDSVDSIRRRVAAWLAQGRTPRLKQVAVEQGVSTRTLIRTLRVAGTTFHEVVDDERRARAAALILRPSVSLAQLARELGFPDRSSFGRRFRAWFGDSPGHFRRQAALDRPRARTAAAPPGAQGLRRLVARVVAPAGVSGERVLARPPAPGVNHP